MKMDKLKKQRSPIRTMITRTINESEMELGKDQIHIITIKLKYEKLVNLQNQIQQLDQHILDELIDLYNENMYAEEVEMIQEYIDKIMLMKIRIDDVIGFNNERERVPSENSSIVTVKTSKRQFKLPKIELKKFNGKIIEWLGWWSQFQKIDEDNELHATDKFQYLIQSMVPETRGYDIVKSFPATEENYPKAILALKERFGKKKLLVQVYIRELFKLGINNQTKTP